MKIPTRPKQSERDRARKGAVTRAAILEAAFVMASRAGLEGLTIGALADVLGMSKSGVFAHFGAREELQLAVLEAYSHHFVQEVLVDAVKQPRGVPRVRAIIERWLRYLSLALESGCILIGGAFEYDDRDGPVRAAMVRIVDAWRSELVKAVGMAQNEGHIRADIDARQVAFELYGIVLAMHQWARLLRAADAVRRARQGVARLLNDICTPEGVRLLKPVKERARP